MQPESETPSTLQDNFFYKMPITSHGITLSYLFCQLSCLLNCNSNHSLESFNVLKIIWKQTKTHAFLTLYNHFVYEFASQTNLFYLDGQCCKNILQSSHKPKILNFCINIFVWIFPSTFSVLVLPLVNFQIISYLQCSPRQRILGWNLEDYVLISFPNSINQV